MLSTIFNFIKDKIYNPFLKLLFKYSNTEIKLHKRFFIANYFNVCFKEYIANSNIRIIKPLNYKNKELNRSQYRNKLSNINRKNIY